MTHENSLSGGIKQYETHEVVCVRLLTVVASHATVSRKSSIVIEFHLGDASSTRNTLSDVLQQRRIFDDELSIDKFVGGMVVP